MCQRRAAPSGIAWVVELAQDAAVAGGPCGMALATQVDQLALQCPQFGHPCLYVQQVGVDQLVDGLAAGIRLLAGVQ